MKPDKLTQQLHDKLADYQTPAPDDLWDDIEAALANSGQRFQALQSQSSEQQPPKARFVTLRRWAAAAAVAAIVAGGGLVLYNNNVELREADSQLAAMQEEEPPTSAQEEETVQEDELLTASATPLPKKELLASAATPLPSRGGSGTGTTPLRRGAGGGVSDNNDQPQDNYELPAEDIVPPTQPLQGKEDPAGLEQQKGRGESAEPSTLDSQSSNLKSQSSTLRSDEGRLRSKNPHPLYLNQQKEKKTPSLNLYATNSLGAKDNSNAVFMADALAQNYANTFNEANLPAASRRAFDEDMPSPIYLSGYEEQQHHRQPVAFGLTLDYPLTARLSLTSGVVYTRLRSDFTQVILSQQICREQTLHYIGVPLGLSYRLYQLGAFCAYGAAGFQADWNVAARQNTEGVDCNIDRDRMQWSANASLGLQYDLMPQLALYAEPGINHYFDNGSSVQNFFKEKPTSFRLQLGLRLHLP